MPSVIDILAIIAIMITIAIALVSACFVLTTRIVDNKLALAAMKNKIEGKDSQISKEVSKLKRNVSSLKERIDGIRIGVKTLRLLFH